MFGNIDTIMLKNVPELGKMIKTLNLIVVSLAEINKVYTLHELHVLTLTMEKYSEKSIKIFTCNVPMKGYKNITGGVMIILASPLCSRLKKVICDEYSIFITVTLLLCKRKTLNITVGYRMVEDEKPGPESFTTRINQYRHTMSSSKELRKEFIEDITNHFKYECDEGFNIFFWDANEEFK